MNKAQLSLKQKLLDAKDTTEVKVRFNDTDAMGVVHFKNYMVYFDDGFVSFMNSIKNKKNIEEMIYEGLACGVKHVDITYEGSAKFGEYIIVNTNIKSIGNTSITFNHELLKKSDNTLLARGIKHKGNITILAIIKGILNSDNFMDLIVCLRTININYFITTI